MFLSCISASLPLFLVQVVGRNHLQLSLSALASYWLLAGDQLQALGTAHSFPPRGLFLGSYTQLFASSGPVEYPLLQSARTVLYNIV